MIREEIHRHAECRRPWQLLATPSGPCVIWIESGREDKHSAVILDGVSCRNEASKRHSTIVIYWRLKRPSAQPLGARGFHLHTPKGLDPSRCDITEYDGKYLLMIYRIWKCVSEVVWEERET